MSIKNRNFASAVLIDDSDNYRSSTGASTMATAQVVPYGDDHKQSYTNYSSSITPVHHQPSTMSSTNTTYYSPPPTNYGNTVMIPHGGTNVAYMNPYAPETIGMMHAEALATKQRRRRRRRTRTTIAAVSGAVVGGIALGPLGAIAGGIGAGAATRAACKATEKRKDSRVEKQKVQETSVSQQTAIVNAVHA